MDDIPIKPINGYILAHGGSRRENDTTYQRIHKTHSLLLHLWKNLFNYIIGHSKQLTAISQPIKVVEKVKIQTLNINVFEFPDNWPINPINDYICN